MKVIYSSETSGCLVTTRLYNPVHRTLHSDRRESLKSNILSLIFHCNIIRVLEFISSCLQKDAEEKRNFCRRLQITPYLTCDIWSDESFDLGLFSWDREFWTCFFLLRGRSCTSWRKKVLLHCLEFICPLSRLSYSFWSLLSTPNAMFQTLC